MRKQLSDPAQICDAAVWFLGSDRGIEATLGLAAFNSPAPFRDVSACEDGVWLAFCRASSVVSAINKADQPSLTKQMQGDPGWPGRLDIRDENYAKREDLLRRAATWIREHNGVVLQDDEVQVLEESPGRFVGRIKDPKLSYLGPCGKPTPEEALADARELIQRVRDREAFEAGDDSFEEVSVRTCGVSSSFIRKKTTSTPE